MRVHRGFLELRLDVERPAVSIGNFDGVHLGHQAVIASAVEAGRRDGRSAVVCTFDPHTRAVLEPGTPPRLLVTLEQRLEAIAALGVDATVVIPFDRRVAATPHEEFVERFLLGTLDASSVHVSEGFTFGRSGAGDVDYLQRVGERHGFTMTLVPPVLDGGEPISSTRVRQAVASGEMGEAARLLGRPFALIGTVVPGAGRGADLEARTANLAVENGCLPARGVYVSEATVAGGSRRAVSNVGVRPTFEGGDGVTVEAHLLNFSGHLYGERMELSFLQRIREERAFESADALAEQIRKDVRFALDWFESHSTS